MKQLVKRMLCRTAPHWTTALQSARARARSHRVYANRGCHSLNRKLIEHLGNCVQDGPFAGLLLIPRTYTEHIGPYLLGVYESELDIAWEIVFRGAYDQIIDVGAKFGYYAVGLARRFPDVPVVAFDTDWWARRAVREMAAANGTARVEVRGFCTPDWLAKHASPAAFVISDCEGYEGDLFGPDVAARLRTATLLIETHDNLVPGVSDRLLGAFRESHSVRIYGHDEARRDTAHALDFFTAAERSLARDELRTSQMWLLCLPREGPNARLGS